MARVRWWAAAILLLSAAAFYAADKERDNLLREKRRVQLQLAETRVVLLRENAECRELNERIASLQRLLMRKLDSQPEMVKLYEELARIDAQLREQK